jgi:hypothetical protein
VIRKLIERVRKGPRYRYKRADNGQFCSKLYALLHPATTYKARLR